MKERTFLITGSIYAVAEFATEASWHFEIEERDDTYPNVSSGIGTIDVHYPCQWPGDGNESQAPIFRATITIYPDGLENENAELPSVEQFREALFREFEIGEDARWYLGYYEVSRGEEDFEDSHVYI